MLVEAGVVWFARREGGWESESERVLRAQGIPVERLDPAATAELFPSLATDDLAFGLLEPEAGVLRAGDGVRALVRRAREGGLQLLLGEARPDGDGAVVDGRRLEADRVVWACGGWLAGLFPEHVAAARHAPGRRPVRGRSRSGPRRPRPAGSTSMRALYGHGSIEPYGMKVASDREGEPVEPGLRAGARPRAPAWPRPATSSPPASRPWPVRPCARRPACHYSLTADGNFLFARATPSTTASGCSAAARARLQARAGGRRARGGVLAGEAEPEPRFGLGERTPSRALRTAGS